MVNMPLSFVASCIARRSFEREFPWFVPLCAAFLECSLEAMSLATSFGRFALDTASARSRELSNSETILNRDEPHRVHLPDPPPIRPNECPHSQRSNCQSLLTALLNNLGTSPCRDKDEHLGPPKGPEYGPDQKVGACHFSFPGDYIGGTNDC